MITAFIHSIYQYITHFSLYDKVNSNQILTCILSGQPQTYWGFSNTYHHNVHRLYYWDMYVVDVAVGMAEAEAPLTKTLCITTGGEPWRKQQE
jgi:hypothetical protein